MYIYIEREYVYIANLVLEAYQNISKVFIYSI